ncbi:nucleolar protein 58 [Trichonephila inaurata madagascariensis]|uniref:Nucleolar protein 58 n=1 Tax=Trichonephila inaurata madagascariensis TaxID=2747483 RepID=A0A8X6XAI1_9ARAC|nr:nucleolar protein 58 [Trichonephila inaurata madagascariensis]
MLVLFETSAGFAIFKVLKEKKLQKSENLYEEFLTPEKAGKLLKLIHFEKFKDMEDALATASATVEGKMSKKLKKCLKRLIAEDAQEELAVADAKLGSSISSKLNITCVHNSAILELMRCIRMHMDSLLEGIKIKELAAMSLGIAHGLARYKFKFSPDKIDKMVIEAVSTLDELDKELNNYVMRCKEWYGWHFPELAKLIPDNKQYIKIVVAMGFRENAANTDFSGILSEEDEQKVKAMAEISMGTEIMEDDVRNISNMCQEILNLQEYRTSLAEYLKNRMAAVAPNITSLVGEMVGSRLIAHAGSLISLAKHPGSTVQILGAEKALFRALKARHDTPKYGLIYHAQYVGQSSPAIRGKASRMLAAKTALAARVDAFGEEDIDIGTEHRAKLERTLKYLEENKTKRISGTGKSQRRFEKYENKGQVFKNRGANTTDSSLPFKGKRKFPSQGETSQAKKFKVEVKKESN